MPTVKGPPTHIKPTTSGLDALFNVDQHAIQLQIRLLEDDVVRVAVGNVATQEQRTWVVVDSSGDVPFEGKLKSDLSRFTNPNVSVALIDKDLHQYEIRSAVLTIQVFMAEDIRLEVHHMNFGLIFADARFDAYRYGEEGNNVFRHTMKCDLSKEHYYGFGESTGVLKKNGRRLRVDAKDSMGYDAETSDPLYKHWPYHLTVVDSSHGTMCYGLLYDTMRRSLFDIGKEISAFRGLYRYFETDVAEKGLDYYIMCHDTPSKVSRSLMKLIGAPALPPRWAMGYLGSSMAYTESENAMERLGDFLSLLKRHRIPCDGFHLSSGYTTDAGGRRCVFTWNRQRVPNPTEMFHMFNKQHVNVVANVKPWLLREHVHFETAKAEGLFFKSPSSREGKNDPSFGRFWVGDAGTSGLGCYFDFTNPKAVEWWKLHAKQALLELGCRGLWNDNNEYEVDESKAKTSLGDTVEASGRALHTLLMARASNEALRENSAQVDEPVLVVSRSGSIGAHRYAAQTWSGDNFTSWKTLKYNIAMCLSLGISGWPGSGPDVGGFAGGKPSQELFLRWVQSGVFMPRFSIHSSVWKQLGTEPTITNEPWMFPEITDGIRKSIEVRYRLKPWLYSLHVEAARTGAPVARPLLYHFADQREIRDESFQFLLGSDVLVAPIYDPGVTRNWTVCLPAGHVWLDVDAGRAYKARDSSSRVTLELDSSRDVSESLFGGCPVLIKLGGGLVLAGDRFSNEGEHIGSDERVIIVALGGESKSAVVEWYDGPDILCSCDVTYSMVVGLVVQVKARRLSKDKAPEDGKKRQRESRELSFDKGKITLVAYMVVPSDGVSSDATEGDWIPDLTMRVITLAVGPLNIESLVD